VAIAASEQLSKAWKRLEKKKIVSGVEKTKWEGRLEIVSRNPLVILDGAHNEEGVRALKKYFEDFPSSPLILVFAIMRDKEIAKITDILFPLAKRIILTRFPYFRAALPEEIKKQAQSFQDRIVLEPDMNQAIDKALRNAGSQGCVLAAGSLFLVGEFKKRAMFSNGPL
jgi:dihydrofolate synthase/folylpolyglutamate synthase